MTYTCNEAKWTRKTVLYPHVHVHVHLHGFSILYVHVHVVECGPMIYFHYSHLSVSEQYEPLNIAHSLTDKLTS